MVSSSSNSDFLQQVFITTMKVTTIIANIIAAKIPITNGEKNSFCFTKTYDMSPVFG